MAPDPRSGSQFPGGSAAWEGLVCAVARSKGQFSLEAAATEVLEKEGDGDTSRKTGRGKRCEREGGAVPVGPERLLHRPLCRDGGVVSACPSPTAWRCAWH